MSRAHRRVPICLGALVAMLAALLPLDGAHAATTRHRVPQSALRVSAVRLLADGTVRVDVAMRCPVNRPRDFSALYLLASQGPAANAGRTISPVACSGETTSRRLRITSTTGQPYRPGPVELDLAVNSHCERTPHLETGECPDVVVANYSFDLTPGRTYRPVPRLAVSRVRLLRDGTVRITAKVTCPRDGADDFSLLDVRVSQGTSADRSQHLRPVGCTGRRQRVRLDLASSTAHGFRSGRAAVQVRLLSRCRSLVDDEGFPFDICLSEASSWVTMTL